MSDYVAQVTDRDFKDQVIESSKSQPVLVDFWAAWCRPCLMLAPTVDQIAQEYAGKVKVVKLNVDENRVADNFQIRSIPTLLVFKGGVVVNQMVGLKAKEEIEKALQPHIR